MEDINRNLFLYFESTKEREKFVKLSTCIELQYCGLKVGTPKKKIVSISKIESLKPDSLYIKIGDFDMFEEYYSKYFCDALYNNMKTGFIDPYGINYFTKEQTNLIINLIEKEKPIQYELLIKWMSNLKNYNGIYFLGV